MILFRFSALRAFWIAFIALVLLTAFTWRLQAAGVLSPEVLGGSVAVIVAFVLAYAPGLNTWYAALPKETKGLIALGLMAAVSGLTFAQACTTLHLLPWATTCDQTGAETLIKTFFIAAGTNQALFLMLPQTAAVKAAKSRPA